MDDLRWLLDRGIVRLECWHDVVKDMPRMEIVWQIPAGLIAVVEAHKDELVEMYNKRRKPGAPMVY